MNPHLTIFIANVSAKSFPLNKKSLTSFHRSVLKEKEKGFSQMRI